MTSFERFLDNASSDSHLRIEADLGDGFVRLRSDEADRRQAAQDIRCSEDIVIELLRNSRDAHAHVIFLAISSASDTRSICIIDDGDGIPKHLHGVMFEPRVTSKLDSAHKDNWGFHGRGMALYSIRENSIESRVCCSSQNIGTSICVKTNLLMLPEKADQSTFPSFKIEKDNTISIRGPKNIIRTVCEFSLDERNGITVYIGSPAEISAALLEHAYRNVPFEMRAFSSEEDEDVPLVNRPAYCPDAESLMQCYSRLGLDISIRTAQRIMNGEIGSPLPVIQRIANEGFPKIDHSMPQNNTQLRKSKRQFPLDKEDIALLDRSLEIPMQVLANKYYLALKGKNDYKLDSECLRITIPIIPQDYE